MTSTGSPGAFENDRIAEFLAVLELMTAGDLQQRLKISDRHDDLDAIAHGINVLVGELGRTTTERLELQEARAVSAEQANASKNIFLRNMSHEIRTPITAMLGFADLLASTDLAGQDGLELLRRLQANGLAVLSLLDNLLDLAKLDAHKVVLNPESVSVVELVQEVIGSLEIDSRAKGLEIRVEAAEQARASILTDRYRLRQILVNIIANAVKFTPTGSVVVSLSATHDTEGESWTIDVTDTGIGIAPDRHAHLFEPFEQGSDSISRVYGGSGLGLALSRRLAERMGGALVLLRSTPGAGTAFRLTLRAFQPPMEPESVVAVAAPNHAAGAVEGWRILLAEDHRDLNLALRSLLVREGAIVESAHDGHEAVAKAMSGTFDVVLMDLRMPLMDGLEAARLLRSQGSVIPIIALTADPTLRGPEALEAGFVACLSKPFTLGELTASIQLSSRPSPP
jgi:signal transduction histidine kinase/CheY-like chemotaxis protein